MSTGILLMCKNKAFIYSEHLAQPVLLALCRYFDFFLCKMHKRDEGKCGETKGDPPF